MNPTPTTDTLFYPFHLCHEETLQRLLARFHRVHFRDYMAIQLSPFSGTTAYADRMGGTFPELVTTGRLVQGHNVSGPLSDASRIFIDRDLADNRWRTLFHTAIREDRRFQRGLFDPTHAMTIGRDTLPGPAALLRLMDESFLHQPFTVKAVQQLSCERAERRYCLSFRIWPGIDQDRRGPVLYDSTGTRPTGNNRHRFVRTFSAVRPNARPRKRAASQPSDNQNRVLTSSQDSATLFGYGETILSVDYPRCD